MAPSDPATPPGVRVRLARARAAVRRSVLRRRRLLLALCLAVAVAAGLHATMPPPPPRVLVMTAASDLAAGSVVTPDDLVATGFTPGSVPDGLADDPVGRVLAAPLRRGEPVTDARLVAPSLLEDYPGLVAVPVRLPDAGAAGLLRAGDLIDLVAADPQGSTATTVATDAAVLAVPSADPAESGSGGSGGSAPPGRLVVLAVEPTEVAGVADASARLFLTPTWRR
ncbi:RcpC/CpaB family pilus assembly protein [Nocardioides sp. CFH 31398]|uniref:RcpC/CpaB family pilus assembly protein n=1 Tax=Nocardioides sp. CFH 31398 TaxID=2919579 RepID=UPI001F0554AC|nr:RcpC/CpaB family pilus assembly protein [Nocardioides sp. CFH 31398]MCH1865284.1 RcpC/CpaB family pilus assembly protein [Nocardioides sp. CFH 31398]